MIRVFHIIPRLDVGGAERVAVNIASVKDVNVDHHIVEVFRGTSCYSMNIRKELRDKGITYHRALCPLWIRWHYVFERLSALVFPIRFLFLWIKYRPNVIHSHTEIADMAVWISYSVFPFVNAKIVRTIHNTKLWTGMNFVGPRVEHFMQRRDANIAISKNVQNAYHDKYGTVPKIIYNGVASVEQHDYPKLVENKINICFAGRFEEQKGIATLCEIVENLKNDSRYYFHIFGSGRMQSLIDGLKDLPNVSVNDAINGIATYLGSFDYIIMPSVHEGLSILALEASFNGTPLMINRCEGLSDTLPDDWPLAVSNNNITEWLEMFNVIIPSLDRETLRESAMQFVQMHFSLEKMQMEYRNLYM